MSLKYLKQCWDHFWFDDGSPVPVALFRILFGITLVIFCIWNLPEVTSFCGQHSITMPGMAAHELGAETFDAFSFLPNSDFWLLCIQSLMLLASITMTLGFHSRLSAIVVYLSLLSLGSRNLFLTYEVTNLMCSLVFFLIFSRCGDAISFDRLCRIWSPKPEFGAASIGSIIGQRLIQIQACLVYWSAFSAKLHGAAWMDGTAVYYTVHFLPYQQFAATHLFDSLWVSRPCTWGTLVIEFSLCTLIWIKEIRYPLLMLGIVFHLGMESALFVPLLQFVMMSTYITFVYPEDLTRVMSVLKGIVGSLAGSPLVVEYNANCEFSLRLAETVRRLDIFGLINIEAAESTTDLRSGMAVRFPGGTHSGIKALRIIALRLPLLLPLYPFFFLPGSSWILSGCATILSRMSKTQFKQEDLQCA